MSLWKIAWRSLAERRLSSLLTCLSMALGVALVVSVLVVNAVVQESFTRNAGLGYHMVIGGKNGSKLGLVLATSYYVGDADEPLSYRFYKRFHREDELGFGHRVKKAVPICLGDSYQNYRVVATTPELFSFEYASGKTYEFARGRNFQIENFFEAVIGSRVAETTGLKVGDTFRPTHGVSEEGGHVHEDDFTVVGVLARSGTPNDRALFINMEGFYLMESHSKVPEETAEGETEEDTTATQSNTKKQHGGRQRLPENQREVSAVLVLCGDEIDDEDASVRSDFYARELYQLINEGRDAQAASPAVQIEIMLEEFIKPVRLILVGLAILTVLVAGIGVMVAIYNTMAGRRREIAIIRSLGARRRTVMTLVLLESMLLSVGGGLAGILLGHGMMGAISPMLEARTGISIGFFATASFPLKVGDHQLQLNYELILIPALMALASIAGFVPGLTAYRTDVSKSLAATP